MLSITGKAAGVSLNLNKRFDVTIAGEINLDLVLDGIPETMPVERELLASSCLVTLGSSAAILAHNLAALGVKVGFASMAARDMFGTKALDYLREQGVDLTEARTSDSGAGSGVTVVVNHGTVRHILSYLGTSAELARHHLDLDYLCSAKHFHLSSLFLLKSLRPDLPDLFKAIKARVSPSRSIPTTIPTTAGTAWMRFFRWWMCFCPMSGSCSRSPSAIRWTRPWPLWPARPS